MKKVYSFFALFLIAGLSIAQVQHGGQPVGWHNTETANTIEYIRLPEIDREALAAEDAVTDRYKEFAYRFGVERAVSLNTTNAGAWSEEDGMNVWRLGIHAPNAKGVSVLFNHFDIPKKAELFIYDAERTHFIGSFNYTNCQANGMLATSLIYGENIVIELSIPNSISTSDIDLSLSQIVHAYRGLDSKFEELKGLERNPFGSSGACNVGINCPEGDDWQVQKKTVALIAQGGSAICSGALVNNTANDGYPYFLTANHCLGGGVGNWVFYFNHEASTCTGNTGPTNQSVSGATLLANNGGSDFGLIEINNGNPIPASYQVEFAGWDNSDALSSATAVTGIHHPQGDVKKICHDDDGPTQSFQDNAEVWLIGDWEVGVTEGGSSGSPLFNQDHRIIGQLYGGYAACNGSVYNGDSDWYGRFGVSWDGASSSTRLRDWLDPQNSGITTLDGYPTGSVAYNYDVSNAGIDGVPDALCDFSEVNPVFVLKNNGVTTLTSCTITYSINGGADQTINWTGTLAEDQTENVPLSSFVPVLGTNTVDVEVSDPNGQVDENLFNNTTSFDSELVVGEQLMNLTLKTDNYGYETYWEVRGPNNQVVASGGNTSVGPNGGGNQTAGSNDPGAYGANVTINETIQLDGEGCYTFLIVDDFGDGICCSFLTGSGNYSLTDGNGATLASGGQFGTEEETTFGMVGGLGVNEANSREFQLYPNPSNGSVTISTENGVSISSVSVTDLSGRTVFMLNQAFNQRTTLDLNQLTDGIYLVNVIGENGIVSKKLSLFRN